MENGKKTICWWSNSPAQKSGLGRNTKALLEYLYKTNKYNIVCYASGASWDNAEHLRFPYKIVGALPNSQEELNQIISQYPPEQRDGIGRLLAYGNYYVDKVVKEFKPFAMFASDDVWATQVLDKPWFNKFHFFFHSTIDSFPVMEEAKKQARATSKYFTWLDFAANWMKADGINNVETLPGVIDPKPFFRKTELERANLRTKFKLPKDATIFGFVFRNQLRKEVDPLLQGFAEFLKKESTNAYLLLHTHYSEGWKITDIIKEYNIPPERVISTYVCKNCVDIEVKPFTGQDQDCPHCGIKGAPPTQENPAGTGMITCNIQLGCTEDQLNDVYNLMDFYIHPANAGGLEVPLVEALMTELPIATVNYSFGETFCEQPFVTEIDFEWNRQIETNFRRAIPKPFSIYKIMNKFHKMKKEKRIELGKTGRAWAIGKFSPAVVGKQLEDFIDSLPPVNYDYDWENLPPSENPSAAIDSSVVSNEEWLESLYVNILGRPSDADGKKNWLAGLAQGQNRVEIENTFRQISQNILNEKQKKKEVSIDALFGNTKKEDRILFVIPESLGDCIYATCLLEDLRSLYPDKKIFVATKPQYAEVFLPLVGQLVDAVIPYQEVFDNELVIQQHVLICYRPYFPTQRALNYTHNGQDKTKISFALKDES